MPVPFEDDWSDSDEEIVAGMETDVLLGIPDGRIETDADLKDAAVSRIGGLPAFLPSRTPPFSSSQCKVCSDSMELLLQVWCPFEQSPMDRALYVWGCARSTCQRQAGSVRAWRGLRYNTVYAAKLRTKQTRKAGQQKINSPRLPNLTSPANPFSINVDAKPIAVGLGDQIMGNAAINLPYRFAEDRDDDCSDTESDHTWSSEDSLITAMALAGLADSTWAATPSYPAMYLSTVSEYTPQPCKAKAPASAKMEDPVETNDKAGKNPSWALEVYENSLVVDNIFDRFTKRVGFAGEQCLRYELQGTPLPFASDRVFEVLFPAALQPSLPVMKADFKVVQPPRRTYSTAAIPSCPYCKSSRVFECQLMPNLINVLGSADDKDVDAWRLTEEQRIKAVQDALQRGKDGRRGMEWGTCMVFSCANDCCVDDEGRGDRECWREEHVLVQWDE